MSDEAPRYSVYFVPPAASALYHFGAELLGYDSYAGIEVAYPQGIDIGAWPGIVQEPRRYGFHATLKAPFYLADDADEAQLLEAAADFAGRRSSFEAGALELREIGSFIALTPKVYCSQLHALADACVQRFERFRAPLDSTDRARRLAAPLTARQAAYLDLWGYPYVFEEFRFHMTLTGPLPDALRKNTLSTLCSRFVQAHAAQNLSVGQIVVARQRGRASAFKIIGVFALEGNVTAA